MHQFHILQPRHHVQKYAHVCTFLLQSGALTDISLMHCGICETGRRKYSLLAWVMTYRLLSGVTNPMLVIVNWTLQNKFRLNIHTIFIAENTSENGVCNMARHFQKSFCQWQQWINRDHVLHIYFHSLTISAQCQSNSNANPVYWRICTPRFPAVPNLIFVCSSFSWLDVSPWPKNCKLQSIPNFSDWVLYYERYCDMSQNFSQWERSFLWKLRCHWLKFLRHVAKTLVIQGPGLLTFGNGEATSFHDL